MEYQGKYPIFDAAKIRRYPLKQRRNKVQVEELVIRIREAFEARGYYVQGNQLQTVAALYCKILEKM